MNVIHTPQKRSHRWLVAGPIAALVLTLSMGGTLVSESLHGAVSALPEGARVSGNLVLEAGDNTTLDMTGDTTVLNEGTVLVASRVLATIRAGDVEVTGWNGGYSVSKAGDSVTVAALTTPVFVRRGNHQTIVPAFMQWKAVPMTALGNDAHSWFATHAPLALPDAFIDAQLEKLNGMQLSLPTTSTPLSPVFIPQIDAFLRLSAADTRADGAHRLARLAAIRIALNASSNQLDALLGAWDIDDIFESEEGKKMMPLLLSDALTHDKGDLFLSLFAESPTQALIAAFHPLTRDHARVLPLHAFATDDETTALLLFTTLADTQPQALSELAVRQWQTQWNETMQSGSGVLLFNSALPILQSHIEKLDALQYPERVDRYATAVLAIAEPLKAGITADAQTALNAIRTLRDARRSAAPVAEVPETPEESASSSSVSSAPVRALDPVVLTEQTKALLLNAGFMIIGDTTFTPAATTVSVSDIVFGTKSGDVSLGFTFDPATNVISAIRKDGSLLPYAISLTQMTEWLKTQ